MNGLLHMHTSSVKKLLGHKIGDDEEKWTERAVEALVKKLKKKNTSEGCGTLEDLEFALANPLAPSKCVTIPKSLDGRLQVSHKKGLPHIIYCKVWRWPDLANSYQDLRSIPECRFPYEASSRTLHICINPYHYIRVQRSQPAFYPQSPSAVSWQSPRSQSSSSCASSPSPSIFSEDGIDINMIPPPTSSPMMLNNKKNTNFWAEISYYELNNRIGDVFKVLSPSVIVDGFTNPSNSENRICLGQITNVNRNQTIETTRKHIGRGIQLQKMENNDVVLTNLSDVSVFVQSRTTNIAHNAPNSKVMKVPAKFQLSVFHFSIFYPMLERSMNKGRGQLEELSKNCFLRVSFVKGFGDEYPRADVTSTPCWIEIRLNLPLQYIDSQLSSVPVPIDEQNSRT